MTWATPAEATALTGASIQQNDLDLANGIVELFAGVTEEALDNLKPRDLRLLKMMESYQAAWMISQVDLLGRSDATLMDGDGISYSKGDQDMHILAPLAKRAYKKLSWNRTRTMDPLSPTQAYALRGKRTAETLGIVGDGAGYSDYDDDFGGWERI